MSPASLIMLCAGSVAITLWGLAHITATKSVVSGFGRASDDNRRIMTMEWIVEGLALCFMGVLVLFITIPTGSQSLVTTAVYRLCAAMLVVMAVLTSLAGARTSLVLAKICPFVAIGVAVLFFLATVL